jgi:hypothetical protein
MGGSGRPIEEGELMRRWILLVSGCLGLVLIASLWATGAMGESRAVVKTLSYDAATFVPFPDDASKSGQLNTPITTHSSANGSPCANTPDYQQWAESMGAALQGRGGFLQGVNLPGGATVTALRLIVVDQDATADAHVYLVRKRLMAGVPKDAGYLVMAHVHSTGQLLTNTRLFATDTIAKAVIDPANYAYFLEFVACDITVEPIGVQIKFRP